MLRKYFIPLLALAGVIFAVYTVICGEKKPPQPPPISDAPQVPYPSFVAGSGIVEASTENISIGTQLAGIVSKIFVQIGSNVKANDPLFTIDGRALRAEAAIRRAAIHVAETQLADAKYQFGTSRRWPPRKSPARTNSRRAVSPCRKLKRNLSRLKRI